MRQGVICRCNMWTTFWKRKRIGVEIEASKQLSYTSNIEWMVSNDILLAGGLRTMQNCIRLFYQVGLRQHLRTNALLQLRQRYVFIYLFNDAGRSSDYIASNGMKWIPKDVKGNHLDFEVLSRDLPGRGTEENHDNPQNSRCPHRDSNRAPPKH